MVHHIEISPAEMLFVETEGLARASNPMRSVYLSLIVSSIDEAERIYALLSDGGQIFMPMEETFFAFRFAMLQGQVRHVLDGPPRTSEGRRASKKMRDVQAAIAGHYREERRTSTGHV